MSKNDHIKRELEAQFYADSRIDNQNIVIEESNGEITLRGTVGSLAAMEAVESAIRNVPEIKFLKNNLKIRYFQNPGELSEEKVYSNLKTLLKLDRNIDPTGINISVNQGVVTLMGSVKTLWEKEYCENIVKNVAGVLQIISELNVVATADFTDRQIAEQIQDALQRINAIEIEQVTIFVEKGIVRLSGKVPDWNSYYASEYAARNTRGVVEVKNELLLSY